MPRPRPEWIGKHDGVNIPPRVRQRSICSVEGCDRYVTGQGLCNMHYRRLRRHGSPTAGGTQHGAAEQFLADAVGSDTDTCIEWPFAINNGYGSINSEHFGTKYAHVYVCQAVHGPQPSPNHLVCHAPIICNNPKCINPRHLRWDTQRANRLDSAIDGTTNRGERSGTARLTEQDVLAIRSSTEPMVAVASRYNVSPSTIFDIRHRKTWRHI